MKSNNLIKLVAALTFFSVSTLAFANAQSTINGNLNSSGQTGMPTFFNFTPPTPPAPPAPIIWPGTTPMPTNPNPTPTNPTPTNPNPNPGWQYPTTPTYPGGYPGGWNGGYPGGWPGNPTSTTTARVYVVKYVNGMKATASTTGNIAFMVNTLTGSSSTSTASTTGTLTLAAGGANPYQASTDVMKGMNFSLNEVMNSNTGAMCTTASTSSSTTPFALAGYSVGNTMGEAVSASKSSTTPMFTNLQSDKYVIVWNTMCSNPNGGTIGGDVTGGATTSTSTIGVLKVNSIETQQGTATADGTFTNGWKFVFNITVPTNETSFFMRFADWVNNSNASSTIPVANNMRISSAQAATSTPVVLTAAGTYSTTPLIITGDLDAAMPGRQIKVLVETAVPVNSLNGSYTTAYSVKTQ